MPRAETKQRFGVGARVVAGMSGQVALFFKLTTSRALWASTCSGGRGFTGQIGTVRFTRLTEAGASRGANFNGPGPTPASAFVATHEMAETVTDPFPSTGWLASSGAENGDKRAWISSGQGAAANVTLTNGSSVPAQSRWSNAFNSGSGGCVLSYP